MTHNVLSTLLLILCILATTIFPGLLNGLGESEITQSQLASGVALPATPDQSRIPATLRGAPLMFIKDIGQFTDGWAPFLRSSPIDRGWQMQRQEADNGRIAYVGQDYNIWLVNADGSELRQITFDADPESVLYGPTREYWKWSSRPLRWSPDGSRLAFVRSERIENASDELTATHILIITDQDGNKLTPILTEFEGYFDWSPQGDQLVYSRDDALWILDVQTLQSTRFLSSRSGQPVGWVDWSPDGTKIAFHEYSPPLPPDDPRAPGATFPGVAVADVATGEYVNWDSGIIRCSWAPDSSALACNTWAGEYCGELLDVRGHDGTTVRTLGPFLGLRAICNPLWSPDGTHITFVSQFEALPVIIVDAVTGQTRMLTNFDATPISWSPSGNRLLVNASDSLYRMVGHSGAIYSVDVDSGDAQEIAQGGYAVWQPLVPGPSVGDLLTRKQAAMTQLQQTSVDILGLSFLISAYDEEGATKLVQHIREEAESGSLSPDQAEAFARVTIQEEGLADLLPLYSQTSADVTEVGADVVGILLSLGREADRALEACYASGNPFSGACLTLRRLVNRQVLRIINTLVRLAIRFIPDPHQQEELRDFWMLLIDSIMLRLDAGDTVQDILLSTVVKGPAVSRLVRHYVGAMQPSLNQGVRSADPTYAGSEPTWTVEGQLEPAELHIEGIVEQATIRAEHAHSVHQDLMRGADVAQLLTDIADLGRLSPLTALARIAAIAARVEHLFVDVTAMAVNYNSMRCTRYLSTRAGSLAFNPNQPGENCYDIGNSSRSSPRMARELGLSGNVRAWKAVWAHAASDMDAYEEAVTNLLTAMRDGDAEAITKALTILDEADQALGSSTDQAMSLILNSDAPDSEAMEAFSQSNQFSLDALELYLLVASYVTAPEDERPMAEVEQAASDTLSSLGEYSESLQAAAPTGAKDRALPVIQTIVLPDEVVVKEPFEVTTVVRNVGSADASAVLVRAQATGQEVQIAEIGTLGTNQTYTTTLQARGIHTGTLTLLTEVAIADSVTDSRVDQVQVRPENAKEEQTDERKRGFCPSLWGAIVLTLVTAVLLLRKRY